LGAGKAADDERTTLIALVTGRGRAHPQPPALDDQRAPPARLHGNQDPSVIVIP